MLIRIAEENGEPDSDGDTYEKGCAEGEREKVAMAQFGHADTLPPGVGKVYSQNGEILWGGHLDLETETGKATFNYIKNMGGSAQFSFRANAYDYSFTDTGIHFKSIKLYEVSPVWIGANNTKVKLIKSETPRTEDTNKQLR